MFGSTSFEWSGQVFTMYYYKPSSPECVYWMETQARAAPYQRSLKEPGSAEVSHFVLMLLFNKTPEILVEETNKCFATVF